MQDAKINVLEGETVSVDQLDRLINLSQTAHHLASVAINKLVAMRHGEGMGSVIWDATRPRNHDNGETRAIVRDSFSPWRR
jgi:hypothetical protein